MARFATIDEYIASCPDEVRPTLDAVRRTIRDAVPGASEGISYGIPAIGLDGRYLVWFAGWKRHVSVYPIPSGDAALAAALEPYRAARGTLRFPFADPIPYDLIGRVAAELLREHLAGSR